MNQPDGVIINIRVQSFFLLLAQDPGIPHKYSCVPRDAGKGGTQIMRDRAEQIGAEMLLLNLQGNFFLFFVQLFFFQSKCTFPQHRNHQALLKNL
ncbi:hypothetical protein D3C74_382880 [compost metagenome]